MAYNKKNDTFALVWAKKIKAINSLGGKCESCGNNNRFCLEFHHFSDDKENKFNTLRFSRWSDIEKELKKCKLLCRNCHKEFHCSSNGLKYGLKKKLMISISKIKCEKCNYGGGNYASLEFHHLRDKKFIISDGLYSTRGVSVSVQELMDEIDKCKVFCANCHIQEHIDINKFNELKDIIMQKVETYKELQKPLDRQAIFNMYNNKKGVCQIAKELNCCKSTISLILTKYKLRSCA